MLSQRRLLFQPRGEAPETGSHRPVGPATEPRSAAAQGFDCRGYQAVDVVGWRQRQLPRPMQAISHRSSPPEPTIAEHPGRLARVPWWQRAIRRPR